MQPHEYNEPKTGNSKNLTTAKIKKWWFLVFHNAKTNEERLKALDCIQHIDFEKDKQFF